MLRVALIAMIPIIALCAKSNTEIHDRRLRNQHRWLLAVCAVSFALCVFFAARGDHYLEAYQHRTGDCPAPNPYSRPILAAGLAGLLGFVYGTVLLFVHRLPIAGGGMAIATVLFVVVVALSWFWTIFCFTM
jgi:hypothetical protein